MASRLTLKFSTRTIQALTKQQHHHASTRSITHLMSDLTVRPSRHHYSTTPPLNKIYSMNSDLSEEEIKKIIDEEVQKMEEEAASKLYPDWKPGQRKRPLVTSYRLEDFEEEASGAPRWTLRDKRCGALAIKVGMMPIWDDWGERHPCTVLYLDNNVVIRNKTVDGPDGYMAVQIGAGERREKHIKKPQLGMYHKYGITDNYPYIVREFRVTTEEALPPEGSKIHARHFAPGQNVDVSGISKGKGFQGGMKRHGFKGMPASHGTSKSHRAIGSTGMCQDPGRVFKGKKMPGHMGSVRVTKQNLRVVKIDRGRDLIYVRGAVPGNKGSFVEIRDSVKRPLFGTDKCEAGKESAFPPLPTFAYEEGVDGSGKVGFEAMMPMQEQDPLEIIEDDAA